MFHFKTDNCRKGSAAKTAVLFCCVLSLAVLLLSACSSREESPQPPSSGDDTIQIVATIFPEYDWVMNILGDNPAKADVSLLMDSGTDLHSYQPTTKDILTVSGCDLFIFVGGESDAWIQDALAEAVNPDMITVNLLDVLGDQVKAEESVEGMQTDAHGHAWADTGTQDAGSDGQGAETDGSAGTGEDGAPGGDDAEPDEHVWLSLRNAAVLCEAIEAAIEELDPAHRDLYSANLKDYLEQLQTLDEEYRQVTEDAPLKTLLFGDRFPFLYLTKDYSLRYYAAFSGCFAEAEASFETILFLSEKVDELGLPAVCIIDGSSQNLAESIIRNTKHRNQKILTLNSMQSVTAKDVKAGASYTGIMEKNCRVLKEALNYAADGQ